MIDNLLAYPSGEFTIISASLSISIASVSACYTDHVAGLSESVGLSVGPESVLRQNSRMAECIWMPFGILSGVGQGMDG